MKNGDQESNTESITVRNKILRAGTIILIICLFAVFLRLHFLSMRYYHQATVSYSSGFIEDAVQDYCWTVRNYYPGNSFSQKAIDQIIAIADIYHEENQINQELATLHKLRAAIYSIKSYYQPFTKTLNNINSRIAELETIPAPD